MTENFPISWGGTGHGFYGNTLKLRLFEIKTSVLFIRSSLQNNLFIDHF